LNPDDCKEFLLKNPIIIDVRPEEVFKSTIYPKGAINITVNDIRKPENALP